MTWGNTKIQLNASMQQLFLAKNWATYLSPNLKDLDWVGLLKLNNIIIFIEQYCA